MMFVFAKKGAAAVVARTITSAGLDLESVSPESRGLAVAVALSYAQQGFDRIAVILAATVANAKAVATALAQGQAVDLGKGVPLFTFDESAP